MKSIISIVFLLVIFLLHSVAQIEVIDNRKKVGLVLSGGGAKGLAHIGVLKVLEEKNIEVDCISGTSMGAVIGSLYAMGYRAAEIEQMIKQQSWHKIFSDKVDSRYLSLLERRDIDRYIVNFPIGKKGIYLPQGVFSRKNIMHSMAKIAKQYNAEIDFKKDLPKSFICIATDLETGEEVVLNKGNLLECVYASMAIPAVFPPANINDKLLIDGGIANNFPVENLKKMGADIIIGVDVQQGEKKKSEINNISDIVFQLLEIYTRTVSDSTKINWCDIYIKPDLKQFNIDDFFNIDEIIKIGENQANEKLKNIIGTNYTPVDYTFLDSFKIKEIKVENLRGTTKEDFFRSMKISLPKTFSETDIQVLINRIYYRYNISFIQYYFSGKNKEILNLKVEENLSKTFNVGMHYNQDQGAEILVNTSFYNLLINQSKLSLDAVLSKYPGFRFKYSLLTKRFPGINIIGSVKSHQFKLYDRSNKIFDNDLLTYKLDINTTFFFKNSYAIGGGFQLIYYSFGKDSIFSEVNEFITNLYGFIDINTLDDVNYPGKGFKFYAELKGSTNEELRNTFENSLIAYLSLQKAISIKDRLTFLPSMHGRGILAGTNLPNILYNITYGENNTEFASHYIPFVGSKYLQLADAGIAVAGLDIRYKFGEKHYLVAKSNIGATFDFYSEESSSMYGYGISYSYNSIIGPLTLTYAKANFRDTPSIYLNIGFKF